MTDRKLLELAPGSRLAVDETVIDSDGHECNVSFERKLLWLSSGDYTIGFSTTDIIALLHRAGLLDELLAEAWDEGRGKGRQEAYADERGGFVEFQNPYRKAGK